MKKLFICTILYLGCQGIYAQSTEKNSEKTKSPVKIIEAEPWDSGTNQSIEKEEVYSNTAVRFDEQIKPNVTTGGKETQKKDESEIRYNTLRLLRDAAMIPEPAPQTKNTGSDQEKENHKQNK